MIYSQADKVRSGLEHCHFGYACITCPYYQSSDVSKIECSTTLGEEAVLLIDELRKELIEAKGNNNE